VSEHARPNRKTTRRYYSPAFRYYRNFGDYSERRLIETPPSLPVRVSGRYVYARCALISYVIPRRRCVGTIVSEIRIIPKYVHVWTMFPTKNNSRAFYKCVCVCGGEGKET